MRLDELVNLTRLYCRDNNSLMFKDADIVLFINQGIDRIKQYNLFKDMSYLSAKADVPNLLPNHYHYILALFASSRLFDMDERFFEGTEKRNEFEHEFGELINNIHSGNMVIYDDEGNAIKDNYKVTDAVVDVYFNVSSVGNDSID